MSDSAFTEELRRQLLDAADEEYRQFTAKLLPGVPIETIIGVRAPTLQSIVHALDLNSDEVLQFRAELPHKYHEENLLHAYMISEYHREDEYQPCLAELNRFLPHVDNWGVCDALSPKIFARHPKDLEEKICDWLRADNPYTIRFGLLMLMKFYLDEFFDEEHFQWVMDISSNAQCVKKAQAWYFATALIKRYDQTMALLENEMLDPEVQNQTVRKALESRRIEGEKKKALRSKRVRV